MPVSVLRRRFSVDEYYQMVQAGILREDDGVELIEGEIVEMAPIGSNHAACVKRLNQIFSQHLGQQILVGIQDPIHLGEYSEPQPDITLLRPRPDFYGSSHPGPEDILLVVEVSDTSVDYDREVKVPLYARSGIREAWLVNLVEGVIEVYRSPSSEGYRQVRRVPRGETLTPESLSGLRILADDLLPSL